MGLSKLSGAEKAAVLLLLLGDELAAEVIKFLEDGEIQRIGNHMSVLGNVSDEDVEAVSEDYINETLGGSGGLVSGGLNYVRKLLEGSLEEWKANEIFDKISPPGEGGDEGGGLEIVRQLEPKVIASFLKNEHPQTCAIVLSHLDGDHAGLVLVELPEKFQTEVTYRMATLERIGPGVLKELDNALAAEFRNAGATEGSKIGGVNAVAGVLNQMDHSTEARILSEIEGNNPAIAEEIRKLMFVFDDLEKVDGRGIQTILKEVGNEDLLLSMKTASELLKEKIFSNMSERAAQMMREDLQAMGPVKLSDVEKAQQVIIQAAKKLEDEGKIAIGGGGEELV
ncbi:MAG: flagellar motor switch protein FliG [Nitrospinota bacterium]